MWAQMADSFLEDGILVHGLPWDPIKLSGPTHENSIKRALGIHHNKEREARLKGVRRKVVKCQLLSWKDRT